MHDIGLYAAILGIKAPWQVTAVDLRVKEEEGTGPADPGQPSSSDG
jgi:hypothetical protein